MSATITSSRRTEPMPGVKGKCVLVTGGTSGIGQAIAVRFAEHGVNVAINYLHRPDEATETEQQVQACVNRVQQEGVRDVLVQGDVSREVDVVMMVEHERATWVDSTWSSTTPGSRSRVTATSSRAKTSTRCWRSTSAARSCAPREAIRHFLAEDKPGVIINVTSVHQLIPKPDYLGYSVSKGGMQNLTRTLALEYAARGDPRQRHGAGATVTPINRAWIDDPVKREQVEESHPDAGGPAAATRWPGWRASSPATTRPTSPARRSSSTAG